MIYLDANVLVACVTNVAVATEQVARLLRSDQPLYVSRLAEYEVRKYLARQDTNAAEQNLDTLLKHKLIRGMEWEAAILQSLKIARQFKQRLWVDSADTLHIGWAMSIGAETFASFDRESGPRALALSVGMKVWPEAKAKDFENRKRLKS